MGEDIDLKIYSTFDGVNYTAFQEPKNITCDYDKKEKKIEKNREEYSKRFFDKKCGKRKGYKNGRW